jgi:steroid delta-isomerase-like uncharacterized protein
MMSQNSAAVIEELFEAFNKGDLDRAESLFSKDLELVDLALGVVLTGPGGGRAWLQSFRSALPDARTELVSIIAQGDAVASEHVGRGTHRGPLQTPAGTIPATGRSIELKIAETYLVRLGKVVRLNAYYDSTTLMRQLGLLPSSNGLADRAMTRAMAGLVRVRGVLRR